MHFDASVRHNILLYKNRQLLSQHSDLIRAVSMPLCLRLLSVTVFRATRSWKDTLQERGAVCGRYPQDACTAAASRRSGIFWLCHGTWLFCFGNTLKIYAFYPNFPLAGSVIGGFYWLFLWNFKEIKHQPFSMTQPIFFVWTTGFGIRRTTE